MTSKLTLFGPNHRSIMPVRRTAVAAALLSLAGGTLSQKVYKHVAAFSIDGLHASDVDKYVALRPNSIISQLLETGFEYRNAFTSGV